MVRNEDETSEWLCKTVCADYEQYAILSFKVVELQRNENVLDVSFEFYAPMPFTKPLLRKTLQIAHGS